HAHASARLYGHRFRLKQPTLLSRLRTCCWPAPHTSLTSLFVCSIAPRSAIASRTSAALARGSVQKKASQPSSSRTSTTRITPPAGRHVARNDLTALVTFRPYCTQSTCCQPRPCPARLASEIRPLP